jgi:hypothetical protein
MNYHYNTYPYGHDYGNSKTCGITYIAGNLRELTMPSTLYEGSREELEAMSTNGDLRQIGAVHDTAHIIAVNGNEFYVGDLAIEQAPSSDAMTLTSRGDITRYWSVRSLAMLLATSGTLIKDREYGLIVVTGLPILTHNEENIEAIKNALEGDHEFVLDGERRIAHIAIRKVIMEGSGANIAHGAIGKVKAGIIDIGGRTTDIYMVNGQTPIKDQCKSHDIGVESAIDSLTESFEKEFRYPLSASDAAKLQNCFVDTKDYNSVATVRNAGAHHMRVDALLSKSLGEVGKRISGFIKRSWASSLRSDVVASDAEYVLLVGGGAYYFEDSVRALFANRLSVPIRPECANAAGYARLALHFFNRDAKEQVS